MPKLKQATLSSLRGVVILEDIQRYSDLLSNPNEGEERILSSLKYLSQKKPCKEVVASTGIDAVLKALENHSKEEIASKAKELMSIWELNKKSQPLMEVRYDNLTLRLRRKAVDMLKNSLGNETRDGNLANILEKEVFYQTNRLLTKDYKRTIQKLVLCLKNRPEERKALKAGDVTHVKLVSRYRSVCKEK